jgi:D-alanyl-D-alanine carboxypeptidase
MDLYASCYNSKIVKDSVRLSTHAWGAGIDFDPEGNPPEEYSKAGMMPQPVGDIVEAEGWKWGAGSPKGPIACTFRQQV